MSRNQYDNLLDNEVTDDYDDREIERNANYPKELLNHDEDVAVLIDMGFEEAMIRKVYIFLKPRNLDQAIEYMTEENGIYQHRFYESSHSNYTKCFINYTEKTETDEEESAWTNDFNWLILPSLITALSIIIAVIGFYVKKINFNKKPKIKTKYDRRKTLDKDIDKREKIALRQQIIDELNAELKSIDDEIAEYNRLAEQKLEEMKAQILEEKQTIERKKLEIEIKKKEATAEREKQLKANPELVSNAKAEKEFERLLSHLDKQEMSLQKQINQKDVKLETTKEADKSNLSKFLERKEFIKNEIAKIEAEIEEIAKEEAEMWEEYKKAKMEAKQRKAEIKAQKVNQTPATKSTKNKATNKSSNKKSTQEKSEESQDQNSSNNSSK